MMDKELGPKKERKEDAADEGKEGDIKRRERNICLKGKNKRWNGGV